MSRHDKKVKASELEDGDIIYLDHNKKLKKELLLETPQVFVWVDSIDVFETHTTIYFDYCNTITSVIEGDQEIEVSNDFEIRLSGSTAGIDK